MAKSIALCAMLLLFVIGFSIFTGYTDTVSAPFDGAQGVGSAAGKTADGVAHNDGAADADADADTNADAVADAHANTNTNADAHDAANPATGGAAASANPAVSAAPDAANPAGAAEAYLELIADASSIHRGFLILVNQRTKYEIPDDIDLVKVSETKTAAYRSENDVLMLSASIVGPLNEMMDAFYAETGRNNVAISSGFRDYARQQEILDDYIKASGLAEALKWASPPGYSEHQTGLAMDLGIYSEGAVRTFNGSGVYAWFRANSWKYGFILRYTKEKTPITGTAEEPWHFRYVGIPHAYAMRENGWCFEEYMEFITAFAYNEPYRIEYGGDSYEVYFAPGPELNIPFDCEFDYSGNNVDGFIVTVKYPRP